MTHRKNRVWLGATRIASLILLTLAIAASGATTSWGYMPPPVQAPNVAPDSFPEDDRYRDAGTEDAADLDSADATSDGPRCSFRIMEVLHNLAFRLREFSTK
jgi:hypothetical protein